MNLRNLCGVMLLSSVLLWGGCTNGDSKSNGNEGTAQQENGGTQTGTSGGASVGINGGSEEGRDVPFSGNRDQIKKAMGAIPGAVSDLTVSNEYGSSLSWTGGRFEEIPVDQWGFSFYRGMMLYAQLHYTTETSGMSADLLFDSLAKGMERRYGEMIMDSENRSSRVLTGFSEEDQEFISRVGTSLGGTDFRMWSSGDTTAPFLITVYRAPRSGYSVDDIRDVYLTWYDREQANAYNRMIESYSEQK